MDRLPNYYLTRPAMPTGTPEAFERLSEGAVLGGRGALVDYALAAPKWQFLCWLADTKDVVLHGSGHTDIAEFEPRMPGDTSEWAHRELVFAASDGIWAMFFAVIDRAVAWSLVNACFSLGERGRDGCEVIHYYFSINIDALTDAWSSPGAVYVLPRKTFQQEPPRDHDGVVVHGRQWASLHPFKPLAVIAVNPEDFPFLTAVVGHDPDSVAERASADPEGFPWLG